MALVLCTGPVSRERCACHQARAAEHAEDIVGEGAYSIVHAVADGRAVKVSKAQDGPFDEEFVREVAAYTALGAVYEPGWGPLPRLYGVNMSDPHRPMLCIEHAGTPFPMHAYQRASWTPERLISTSHGLLRAVAAFHAAGLAHRDLGHRNVLFGAGDAVTIIDGGSVRGIAALGAVPTSPIVCTYWYRAPELLAGGVPGAAAGIPLDAWSTGVLLLSHWTPMFVAEPPRASRVTAGAEAANEARQLLAVLHAFGGAPSLKVPLVAVDALRHSRRGADVTTALTTAIATRGLPAPLAAVISRLLQPDPVARLTPEAALRELGLAPIPMQLMPQRAPRARTPVVTWRTAWRRGRRVFRTYTGARRRAARIASLARIWAADAFSVSATAVLLFGALALLDAAADAVEGGSDAAIAFKAADPALAAVVACYVASTTLAAVSMPYMGLLRAAGLATPVRHAADVTRDLLTAIEFDVHGACGGADRNLALAFPLHGVVPKSDAGPAAIAWMDACAKLLRGARRGSWHTTPGAVVALCAGVRRKVPQ